MSAVALAVAGLIGLGCALRLRAERRRRDELVARACHELRGPLAAAHLALQAAARGPERVAERLDAIDLELHRAGRALDDLAAARAGRRAPDRPEPVDVGGLVARQATAWTDLAPAFGARLSLGEGDGHAVVRADPVRLAQAVGNLLANALRHGGGGVEVAVRSLGDRVRIEVADEGPGLPAPVADLTRRARGGRGEHGRGLAIAADVAERHGGRLVASPGGEGARLALELPAWRGGA
jgi:signal transduction histidine kinase